MKSDAQIQKDVMEQLGWEPFLNASQIGVAVKNGIVTLSGQVDTYSKKVAAENATKKIAGVKAIAEDIQIGISPEFKKTDAEIAEAILNTLKWHTAIQQEKIKIKVDDGFVRLEGEVEWGFQRKSIIDAIENLHGIRFITNLITIKPKLQAAEIQKKINAAFHRNATIDSKKVTVTVSDNKATLSGTVRSLAEKEDAENAVWAAPGVNFVDSKLIIVEPEYFYEYEDLT